MASPLPNNAYPEMHSFPPFYSRQPNQETWRKQKDLWQEMILTEAKDKKIYEMDCISAVNEWPLFHNLQIKRQLKAEVLQDIMQDLVIKGKAECLDGNKRIKYLILWRRPEEWAKMIQAWFRSHHLSGSICTVYEILHGDDSANEEFHNLHPTLFDKALKILEDSSQIQILKSSNDMERGIKFIDQ